MRCGPSSVAQRGEGVLDSRADGEHLIEAHGLEDAGEVVTESGQAEGTAGGSARCLCVLAQSAEAVASPSNRMAALARYGGGPRAPRGGHRPAVPAQARDLNLLDRYSFTASTPAAGALRPLRDPDAPELDENDESAADRRDAPGAAWPGASTPTAHAAVVWAVRIPGCQAVTLPKRWLAGASGSLP